MKKIDDSRIYLIIASAALAIGLVLGCVSFYSILSVEPRIEGLLADGGEGGRNYREAYLMLRDPQIFAGYGNFDAEGMSVKNSLVFFDRIVYHGEEIDAGRKAYLDLLLERRKKGSRLGRNTMAFFFVLSSIFWILFVHERRASKQ